MKRFDNVDDSVFLVPLAAIGARGAARWQRRNAPSITFLSIRMAWLWGFLQCFSATTVAAQSPDLLQAPWGTVQVDADRGWAELQVGRSVASLLLPADVPAITRVVSGTSFWPGQPLGLQIDREQGARSIVTVPVDPVPAESLPQRIALEIATGSRTFPDGRIVFAATDAQVDGGTAMRRKTIASQEVIAGWSDADGRLRWQWKAKRPGRYDVWLAASLEAERQDPIKVGLSIGDVKIKEVVHGDDRAGLFRTHCLGSIYLPVATDYTVDLSVAIDAETSGFNFQALTLVPACEGTPPTLGNDGTLTLHAGDATIRGIQLQWELKEEKRTLGFWTQVDDSAYWDFTLSRASRYAVEILQGCGTGQGGSQVRFAWYRRNEAQPHTQHAHTVVDTGHWQAFQPFSLGHVDLPAGRHRLHVYALKKAGVAVMDLRQVKLRPARE